MAERTKEISRRDFLKMAGAAGATLGLAGGLGGLVSGCSFGKENGTGSEAQSSTDGTKAEAGASMIGYEAATKNADSWSLRDPDGKEVSINLPEGFMPDSKLVIPGDLRMNELNPDLSKYKDWDGVISKVAGYNYDYNDFSPNPDFKSNVQGDMYAWRVFQGDRVIIPGIGELKGSERTSVVVLFLNLQPKVIDWDNEGHGQVYVRHGFTATGRDWDTGTPEKIAETEEKLAGHWLFRQKEGTPEKSYIGVTDSPDNAKRTLFVSAAYRQWGNNEDGTPRGQFQLLRAELVNFNK